MSSHKCRNCGLVNFKTETVCKRCQADLTATGVNASAGFSSARTESAPAQQASSNGGVWRDRKKVVLHASAPLPERCVKCNSAEGMKWKVFSLNYYPAYNILTVILLGFTRYKIVNLELGFCAAHWAKRRQRKLTGVWLMVGGAGLFVLSIVLNGNIALLVGSLILFFIGCCFLVTNSPPVAISKIKDPYIWLKGANENYVNALPQWSDGREAIY